VQLQIPPDIVNNPEAFKRFQEAQAQLTGALGRLLAVSERYPDLKSNQNFLALQSQLEGTENRIAGHLFQHLPFLRGVALHGLDQVGNEIGAALILVGAPATTAPWRSPRSSECC
jgi:hypothetical protein